MTNKFGFLGLLIPVHEVKGDNILLLHKGAEITILGTISRKQKLTLKIYELTHIALVLITMQTGLGE